MPNWGYLLTHAAYHLGLAIWIGGTVVLGAVVAPRLFRELPRRQAGGIFGPALRTFARLRVAALAVTIVAAAVQHFVWESRTATIWIGLRWLALGLLALSAVYEIGVLERALSTKAAHLTEDIPDGDPRRVEFQRLHRRAESLSKGALFAAVVALLLS
jgi:hypothetical protein